MCCRALTRKGIYTLETRLNVRSTSSVSFLFIIRTAGLSCRSCTGSSIISVFMKIKYYSQQSSYKANDIIKYNFSNNSGTLYIGNYIMCWRVFTWKSIYTLETRLNVSSTSSVLFLFVVGTVGMSCTSCAENLWLGIFIRIEFYAWSLSY